MHNTVTLYGTATCKLCREAKALAAARGYACDHVSVDTDSGYADLVSSASRLEMPVPSVLPVLITNTMLYSGRDVLITIEQGDRE